MQCMREAVALSDWKQVRFSGIRRHAFLVAIRCKTFVLWEPQQSDIRTCAYSVRVHIWFLFGPLPHLETPNIVFPASCVCIAGGGSVLLRIPC